MVHRENHTFYLRETQTFIKTFWSFSEIYAPKKHMWFWYSINPSACITKVSEILFMYQNKKKKYYINLQLRLPHRK